MKKKGVFMDLESKTRKRIAEALDYSESKRLQVKEKPMPVSCQVDDEVVISVLMEKTALKLGSLRR
jgi:hypothetical protein